MSPYFNIIEKYISLKFCMNKYLDMTSQCLLTKITAALKMCSYVWKKNGILRVSFKHFSRLISTVSQTRAPTLQETFLSILLLSRNFTWLSSKMPANHTDQLIFQMQMSSQQVCPAFSDQCNYKESSNPKKKKHQLQVCLSLLTMR